MHFYKNNLQQTCTLTLYIQTLFLHRAQVLINVHPRSKIISDYSVVLSGCIFACTSRPKCDFLLEDFLDCSYNDDNFARKAITIIAWTFDREVRARLQNILFDFFIVRYIVKGSLSFCSLSLRQALPFNFWCYKCCKNSFLSLPPSHRNDLRTFYVASLPRAAVYSRPVKF